MPETAIAPFIPQNGGGKNNPSTPSSAYNAMVAYWDMVTAILGGTKTMRDAGKKYLPKLPDETEENYKHRKDNAKFTNIFGDITSNLAQRPFAKEATFSDDTDPRLEELADDIDGRGNNLHNFLGEVFHEGINYALDWILVDYANAPGENRTRAQERNLGVRPYWVRYRADQVIEATTAMINGKEEFVRFRAKEKFVKREGFAEKAVDRVRMIERPELVSEDGKPVGYGPPVFTLFEKRDEAGLKDEERWQVVEGPKPLTIPVIPLVPFLTGPRQGDGFRLRPPMRDAAELQVELFQQESGLKHAGNLTAFPMLAGQGVNPDLDAEGNAKPVKIGPHRVLYAPSDGEGGGGEWQWIEPSAESLSYLSGEVKQTKQDLRELGRQPLTAQTGNLTVVTTAFAAQKGNAAIQAWALNLKSTAEQAAHFTGLWLQVEEIAAEVLVDTDFDLGIGDESTFGDVLKLRERGEISRKSTLIEAKRRGILRADYDPEEDAEDMLDDDLEDDGDLDDEGDIEDDPGSQT